MNGKGEKTMGDTKKENDDIIEFGQAMLHADRRNTTSYQLSEKLKDTNVFRQLQKRQNMNMSCHVWQRLRTMRV